MGPEAWRIIRALMNKKPSSLPESKFKLEALKHAENNPSGQTFDIQGPGGRAGRIEAQFEPPVPRWTPEGHKPGVFINWLQAEHVPKSKEVYGIPSMTGGLSPLDQADILTRQLPNWYASRMNVYPEVLRGHRTTGSHKPATDNWDKMPLYERNLAEIWEQYGMRPTLHPNLAFPPESFKGAPMTETLLKAGAGAGAGIGAGVASDYMGWGSPPEPPK